MNKSEVFEAYINGAISGDHETIVKHLTDDFKFQGPMVQADNRDAFLEALGTDFASMAQGYDLIQQYESGDELCSVYDFNVETPIGKGSVYMVERNKFDGEKIKSAKLVFDSAQFMALMPTGS